MASNYRPIHNITGDVIGNTSFDTLNSIIGIRCNLPLYEANDCKSAFDITKKIVMPVRLQKIFGYPASSFTIHDKNDNILCDIIVPQSTNTTNPIMIGDLVIGTCIKSDDCENINIICFIKTNNNNICIRNNKHEIVAKTFGFTHEFTFIDKCSVILIFIVIILVFILPFTIKI